MKSPIILFLILLTFTGLKAQQATLTATDCMRYAVEHNHDIRIGQLTQDTRRAERTSAAGAFLPQVSASIGAQYNFGRAIDPETNTYTNVSTFYNGYSVQASLPVFDGFQRINQLRAAKASLLMGRNQLRAQQDELALQVFEAYCNVLYYEGTVRMAEEKREQSLLTLRQTQVMAEVGQKSEADVAQMEAQLAADDYEITRQQNELSTALLSLKQLMNFPETDTLLLAPSTLITPSTPTTPQTPQTSQTSRTFQNPSELLTLENPAIAAAAQNVVVARRNLSIARGELSPSISISGGMSTSFNKMLHNESVGFRDQLSNNKGEYVYASVSIPIFNRLQTLSSIRRQRNNLRIAEEELAQKRDELVKLQLQAENDCEGYRKQTLQMQHKVEADSIAARLTTRKYEEGLSSAIDVQTSTATLLESRSRLLQCQLMLALKQKLANYYKGLPLL
ncbi:MAG: TolC family protein [Bacteroidales bacterium]|nr:TolC family protein [Bacteroidales bacterium]